MANVFIEESILQGWADTVREKTGTTDKMLPSALLQQTQTNWGTGGGSGGGESTDLVKYVTFLDEDGTQLYRMPVLAGDTCKDPVDHGDIAAPEKEDTNTIDYVRTGWTAASGGTADADILKNITADKTVYAAYVANTRYYTVNFYDEDGTTLLKTVEATYGADLTDYVPVREGYDFVEWNPSVANITSEFDTVAVWVESAKDEWDYLAESIAKGTYKTDYTIGYTVPLVYNNGSTQKTLNMVLVAFDHDNKADGSGKAAMTFISEESLSVGNISKNASSGWWWTTSPARTYCNETLFAYLPSNVAEIIKPVTKLSQMPGTTSLGETDDSIWVPSATEVGFTSSNVSAIVDGQGEHYSQYFKDNASRQKKQNGSTNPNYLMWQTRTLTSYKNKIVVQGTGVFMNTGWSTEYPSAIGFCI